MEEIERENARLKAALEQTDALIEQQRQELLEIVETARELEAIEKKRSELKEKLSIMKTKALAGTRRSHRLPRPMAIEESGQRLRLAREAALGCITKIEEAFRKFLEIYVRWVQEEEEEEEVIEAEPDTTEVAEMEQDTTAIVEMEQDTTEVAEMEQDTTEVADMEQDREEAVETGHEEHWIDMELEEEEYEEEEDYVANRRLYGKIIPALQFIVDVNEIIQAAVDSGVVSEEWKETQTRQEIAVISLVRMRELGRNLLLGQLRDK